jgi:transcriptional regulator with GAF, ATPase, and Fis domain
LRQALRQASRLEAENRILRAESRPTFLAKSPAMAPVLELIGQIGPSDANVLITGEHGTGKEVVARTLHVLSARATKPMVTVNAGGLSEGVFESELFGHVKGAFTDARADRVGRFELADGSTLFLDEIANVPLNLQATSRRCEIGAKTSICWRTIFSTATRSATARTSPALTWRPPRRCTSMPGRAMFANWIMR